MSFFLRLSKRRFTKLIRPPILPKIRDDGHFDETVAKNKFCLFYFSVPWCYDCSIVTPLIRNLSYVNKYKIFDCDINTKKALLDEKIKEEKRVPTIFFYHNGKFKFGIISNNIELISKNIEKFHKDPSQGPLGIESLAVGKKSKVNISVPITTLVE